MDSRAAKKMQKVTITFFKVIGYSEIDRTDERVLMRFGRYTVQIMRNGDVKHGVRK